MNCKKTSKSPVLAAKTQVPKAKKTKSPKTGKTKSPKAKKAKSPKAKKTKSPKAKKTKSPKAKKTKSPKAKKTKSPKAKKTKSPKAKITKGPKAEKSKSPKSKASQSSVNLGKAKSKSKFANPKSLVSGPCDSTAPEQSVEQASALYDGAATTSNAPSTIFSFLGLAAATWICVPVVASLL